MYALHISLSTTSLITHHYQRQKVNEILVENVNKGEALVGNFCGCFSKQLYFSLLLCFIHSLNSESSVPLSSLRYHCPWWIVQPLRLALCLLLENHSSRLFRAKQAQSVCWWWYTIAMLHSWESSVKVPLRETSWHSFPQSGCILVLNSRQLCSCAHSVTWGQLYCIIFRCTREKDCPEWIHILSAQLFILAQGLSQRWCFTV